MKHFHRHFTEAREKGQSLVEVALFFPIFLVVLAGVVEVSHLVITQNRVSNAARSAARFAANGGEDAGMVNVALNTVTQTLEITDDVWDIWSIRGTLNDGGTGFDEWEFTHIYGISNTTQAPEVDQTALQQRVLAELQVDHQGTTNPQNASGLRIVGTYAIHDVESILGLDALPALVGFNSINALSVMRVTGLNIEPTQGCTGFPIAVYEGIRSVTPPGQGSNPFPNPSDFFYPTTKQPTYESFLPQHVDNQPLSDAKEGYVYKVQNGGGAGNFGWLRWNNVIQPSANTLNDSLTWPGDSDNYDPLPGGKFRGYQEPNDATDREMHIGDWLASNTGAVNSQGVRTTLNEHIRRGRTLRLIVYNNTTGSGQNLEYQIAGFAVFRLHGYYLQGNGQSDSWILGEFIRWDNSCGQQLQSP